jgi:hypothetical protein
MTRFGSVIIHEWQFPTRQHEGMTGDPLPYSSWLLIGLLLL